MGIYQRIKNKLYISTVSEKYLDVAKEYGLGIEIADYCSAENLDRNFAATNEKVQASIEGIDSVIFHAPFNEITPAAIDPMVLDLTRFRYRQSLRQAVAYEAKKVVIHSGYTPTIYFKEWFADRAIDFWQKFMAEVPETITVCWENVMEDEPELLVNVLAAVDHPRFRMCLDVGHANTFVSNVPVLEWVEKTAPYLGHVHLHNNFGAYDLHNAFGDGSIDMKQVLQELADLAPEETTYTVESLPGKKAMEWLVQV